MSPNSSIAVFAALIVLLSMYQIIRYRMKVAYHVGEMSFLREAQLTSNSPNALVFVFFLDEAFSPFYNAAHASLPHDVSCIKSGEMSKSKSICLSAAEKPALCASELKLNPS